MTPTREVRKTAVRLSDGRELSYFDWAAQPGRDAADQRGLLPAQADCQLRYDPLLAAWVMYGAHRQDRSYLPAAADCPLCPSAGGRHTEIPAIDYEVAVFENRYPALAVSAGPASLAVSAGAASPPGALLPVRPSAGRCEVICFTSVW